MSPPPPPPPPPPPSTVVQEAVALQHDSYEHAPITVSASHTHISRGTHTWSAEPNAPAARHGPKRQHTSRAAFPLRRSSFLPPAPSACPSLSGKAKNPLGHLTVIPVLLKHAYAEPMRAESPRIFTTVFNAIIIQHTCQFPFLQNLHAPLTSRYSIEFFFLEFEFLTYYVTNHAIFLHNQTIKLHEASRYLLVVAIHMSRLCEYSPSLSENFHIYRYTMCTFANSKCKHNIAM